MLEGAGDGSARSFRLWKQQRQRERDRAERRQRMPARSPSAPLAALPVAPSPREERRRPRRVASHSEEEEELMALLAERERRERREHNDKMGNNGVPLPTGGRRFTAPMVVDEDRVTASPRRAFSVPRDNATTAGRYGMSELSDEDEDDDVGELPYRLNPASSHRWRSMKPAEKSRQEESKEEVTAGVDLWEKFYYGTKASRAMHSQQPDGPIEYSSSSFPDDLEEESAVGSGQAADTLEAVRHRLNALEARTSQGVRQHPSSRQHSEARYAHHEQQSESQTDHGHSNSSRRRQREDSGRRGDDEVSGEPDDDMTSWFPGHGTLPRLPDGVSAISDVFPEWSLLMLVGCALIGVSGYFVKQLMEIAGLFSSTIPFSLSRAEQDRMRRRLEGLQKELHGFRSAASEIEVHSNTVFEEVRRHLDKMRSERAKHQELIAKEMHELRRYILRMTYEMVEQEREILHQRLLETVGVKDTRELAPPPKILETSKDLHAPAEKLLKTSPISEDVDVSLHAATVETSPREVDTIIADVLGIGVVNDVTSRKQQPIAAEEASAGFPFMSLELSLVLFILIIFGIGAGWRVRNINRRKRWFEEHRHRHREQKRRTRFYLPSRKSRRAATADENGEDDWEFAGSEFSVETVAMMSPMHSDDNQSEDASDMASSISGDRSDYEEEPQVSEEEEHKKEEAVDEDSDHVDESDDDQQHQDDNDDQQQEDDHYDRDENGLDDSTPVFRIASPPRAPVYRMATTERYSHGKANSARNEPRNHVQWSPRREHRQFGSGMPASSRRIR